nr:RICIN domain-containing protein [Ruminococcus sp.]
MNLFHRKKATRRSKVLSGVTSALMALSTFSGAVPGTAINAHAATANWKFDLGGNGAASGYTGVSAYDGYNNSRGYGFSGSVANVSAGGSGAYSDAVKFTGGTFNVDLPRGLYQLTVITGNSPRTTIMVEGMAQMINLTGNNARETIQVPVTDGQLNIAAVAGMNNREYSISAIEITQLNTTGEMKPTIWICGDSTVANYYNTPDTAQHGWGQYLNEYVNTNVFEVRNQASSGQYAKGFYQDGQFTPIKTYGKAGDYYIISIGINDTNYSNADEYYSVVTNMVKEAKAKGMNVILVKQQGRHGDYSRSPRLTGRWFGGQLDTIGKEQNVQVVDLFNAWQDFGFSIGGYDAMNDYYASGDDLHQSAKGAKKNAELVAGLMKLGDTEMDTDTYYTFKNVNSGLVMDVDGGKMETGANIQQWESNGQNNQKWKLTPFANGTTYYYVRSAADENYVLKAMSGDSGGNIELVPYSGSDSMMLFQFTKLGDGSYYISTRSSRDACFVETASASKSNGANVQQWGMSFSKCQNWKAEKTEKSPDDIVLGPIDLPYGDVNQDGNIDAFDMVMAARIAKTPSAFTEVQQKLADLNGDYSVNDEDVGMIRDYLAGLKVNVTENGAGQTTYPSRYFAVDAEGYDGWSETDHFGFEGSAYWNFNNAVGSYVNWTVEVPESGDYTLTFRYANGATDSRSLKITTSGSSDTRYLDFPGTGAWENWSEASVTIPLKAGKNIIKTESSTSNGGPNMDYMTVKAYDTSDIISSSENYYAADQTWDQGVIETTNSGYTCEKGYVNLDNNDSSSITFTVKVGKTGNYMTHIRFANGSSDDRKMKIFVNNDYDRCWMQSFTGTGAWTNWTEFGIVLPLVQGINTIKMVSTVAGAGGPNLDYINLTLTDEPYAVPYDPSSEEIPETNGTTVYILGDSTVQSYN